MGATMINTMIINIYFIFCSTRYSLYYIPPLNMFKRETTSQKVWKLRRKTFSNNKGNTQLFKPYSFMIFCKTYSWDNSYRVNARDLTYKDIDETWICDIFNYKILHSAAKSSQNSSTWLFIASIDSKAKIMNSINQ